MARSVTAVSDAMMDRARGALLGTLVGDALGRPFEGSPRSDRPRLERALRRRLEAPRAWLCSDDGEMMLALAEAIAAHRRVDEGDLLDSLARRLEPARGFGKGTRAAIGTWRRTGSWELAARSLWLEGSRGNGAAVRVAPVAVWLRHATRAHVVEAARRSARGTHAHPEAIDGAVTMAASIHHLLRGEPVAVTVDPQLFERAPGVLASESVPAALAVWASSASFEECVTNAILLGGDTDSVGAMAGALAGAASGARSIPPAWLEALDPAARARAEELADLLGGHHGPDGARRPLGPGPLDDDC